MLPALREEDALVQATQLRLEHAEAEEETKKQQAEARRLAVRNKDLESRSQVHCHLSRLSCDSAVLPHTAASALQY